MVGAERVALHEGHELASRRTVLQIDDTTAEGRAGKARRGCHSRNRGETFGDSLQSIDAGQTDASVALGMSYKQRMRRIILPQAFRRMIPPLAGQSIIQMKNTTLLSMITVPDLLYQAGYISSFTYKPMEVYTAVGAIFLLLLTPLTMLSRRLERREDRQS